MNQPEPAFRELYDQQFSFVWRALRRLGVSAPDMSDATQKVFLGVRAKWPELEGRSRPTTVLFAICQRVAGECRRSTALPADNVESAAQAAEASAAAAHQRRVRFAEALLDRLPEAQRVVFVLFELEGMSGDEIAALLDLPIGTVRSRLRLAREAFRREVRRLSAAHAAKQAV